MPLFRLSPEDKDVIRRLNLRDPGIWLATWFGLGFLNPAPGTWGSLGALPFAVLLLGLGGVPALALGILAVSAAGFWAAGKFQEQSGKHDDNKMIVIDEVAGQWIALLPAATFDPLHAIIAFILFRAFDILKPWPVSYLDKNLKGAAGVMADDLAAGAYAALCLAGLRYAGLG